MKDRVTEEPIYHTEKEEIQEKELQSVPPRSLPGLSEGSSPPPGNPEKSQQGLQVKTGTTPSQSKVKEW